MVRMRSVGGCSPAWRCSVKSTSSSSPAAAAVAARNTADDAAAPRAGSSAHVTARRNASVSRTSPAITPAERPRWASSPAGAPASAASRR